MTAKRLWQTAGMWIVYIALVALCAAFVPKFATLDSARDIAMMVATTGLVACAMLFCLAAAEVDLSVGSVAALSGVAAAWSIKTSGNLAVGIAFPLILGLAVGVVNGLVVSWLRINSLIATLAMMQIARGFAQLISKGSTMPISHPSFGGLGKSTYFGVPSPVLAMGICLGIFGFVLNRTVFGRNTLAVGGNLESARLAGIRVEWTKTAIFGLVGLMAAVAGLMAASRVTLAEPNSHIGLELQVISGCVLGGVSLTGGVGSISGVIVGVLIMGTVQQAMTLKGIDPYWQLVVSGLILLGAVMLDRLKSRR